MRILESNDIFPVLAPSALFDNCEEMYLTYFLNCTSATKSRFPLMLSARNTLPVVAIATI